MKPSFNCFVKLVLSLKDKVTIGTYNLVCVILNDTTRLAAAFALEIIQSLCHVNSKSILQLTNGFSNDLKKLLTYFKGTTNFTLLTLLLSVPLISFDLYTKLD